MIAPVTQCQRLGANRQQSKAQALDLHILAEGSLRMCSYNNRAILGLDGAVVGLGGVVTMVGIGGVSPAPVSPVGGGTA